jgi:hypothetical protein
MEDEQEDDLSFGLSFTLLCFDGYKNFLHELFHLLSSAGRCVSSALISQVFGSNGMAPTTSIARELFDLAYRLDFSADNALNHTKFVSTMIKRTTDNYLSYWNYDSFVTLISLWIGYAEEGSLPRNFHLVDLICLVSNRVQEARKQNRFDEEMEPILDRLVRCDGRPLETILEDVQYMWSM